MRILFIMQGWQPESALKGMPFAKELQKLGHTIEVLTGYPHYPQGKLYPGYRIRFLQRETMDGVSVIRVPLYPSHDRSAIRRMATYFSYAFSASAIGPWVVKRAAWLMSISRLRLSGFPPACSGCCGESLLFTTFRTSGPILLRLPVCSTAGSG